MSLLSSSKKSAFMTGFRDMSPLVVGTIPFGTICGAVCVSLGIAKWPSIFFTWYLYAGASQLAGLQLMADHASIAVVVLTILIINARFMMYSASMSMHFPHLHPLKKLWITYNLTDQAYALCIARYNRPDSQGLDKYWYFLGSSCLMWLSFNGAAVVGAYVGAIIPPTWHLDFAIPLTFMALVLPAVKDRPSALAAIVAGIVALVAAGLPFNLGLLAGAVCGIATGWLAERRMSRG